MTKSILSYQQEDSIRLQCEIDLEQLFPPTKKRKRERERFENKWKDFLESDPCNKEISEFSGRPSKKDMGVASQLNTSNNV